MVDQVRCRYINHSDDVIASLSCWSQKAASWFMEQKLGAIPEMPAKFTRRLI
jgi:hypothetical protein